VKLTEILPGVLYQSAEFPKITIKEKLSILETYGIDIVVNLYKNPDEELEDRIYRYIYFPMSDGKVINQDICKFSNYVAKKIVNGHAVLTHCHAGRNRSGFFNALVVRKVLKISGEQALEYVRRKRPRAIDNIYFEEYLRKLP